MNNLPLDGIKIVDLSTALAAPFCTQLLADFGAQVLKIEPPGKGDLLREFGPPFAGGESYYFLLTNRNKRSMTLNLQTGRGVEIFHRLASGADVVIESYRPIVKKKLGVDYDDLREENPGLIYASVSGFGQSGPYADKAGFDPIAQGMSGIASVTGWKHTGPVRTGVAIGDCLAGIFMAYGIMAALFERVRSGKGQRVETSLLESLIAILGMQAARYFGTNERPEPQGNDHALTAPYGTFKTGDGFINIAAGSQFMWEKLVRALAMDELGKDPRFLTAGDRMSHRPELTRILEAKLVERTTREWETVLNEAGVANGPILHIDEVFRDPQVLHLGIMKEMIHPTAGKIKTLGTPVNLSRTPAELKTPPPLLGQHTNDVLQELGFSMSQIAALREEGIV